MKAANKSCRYFYYTMLPNTEARTAPPAATKKVIFVDGGALDKVSLLQTSVVQQTVEELKGNTCWLVKLPLVPLPQNVLVFLQPEVLKFRFTEKTVNAVEK